MRFSTFVIPAIVVLGLIGLSQAQSQQAGIFTVESGGTSYTCQSLSGKVSVGLLDEKFRFVAAATKTQALEQRLKKLRRQKTPRSRKKLKEVRATRKRLFTWRTLLKDGTVACERGNAENQPILSPTSVGDNLTATPMASPTTTVTATISIAATITATITATATATTTANITVTATPTPTATATVTVTVTRSPARTPTSTPTKAPTSTPTDSPCDASKALNVADFGADPAPSNDDTAAFEAALSALNDPTTEQKTLCVSDGLYHIARPLVLRRSGTLLRGFSEQKIQPGAALTGAILRYHAPVDATACTCKSDDPLTWQNASVACQAGQYKVRPGDFPIGVLNIVADNITISHLVVDQNARCSGKFRFEEGAPGEFTIRDSQPNVLGITVASRALIGPPAREVSGASIHHVRIYDHLADGIAAGVSGRSHFASRLHVHHNLLESTYQVQTVGRGIERPVGSDFFNAEGGADRIQGIAIQAGNNVSIHDNQLYGALDDTISMHFGSDIDIYRNIITTTGGRIAIQNVTSSPTGSVLAPGELANAFSASVENPGVRVVSNSITTIDNVGFGYFVRQSVAQNRDPIEFRNNSFEVGPGTAASSAFFVWGSASNSSFLNNQILHRGLPATASTICDGSRVGFMGFRFRDYSYWSQTRTAAIPNPTAWFGTRCTGIRPVDANGVAANACTSLAGTNIDIRNNLLEFRPTVWRASDRAHLAGAEFGLDGRASLDQHAVYTSFTGNIGTVVSPAVTVRSFVDCTASASGTRTSPTLTFAKPAD